jgi:hypothetical protein
MMTQVKCPRCAVALNVRLDGKWQFNDALCAELAGTEYQFKPEWCPILSDAAPEDMYLLPVGYRPMVEAAITKAKKGKNDPKTP